MALLYQPETFIIRHACEEVYTQLGSGFLEAVYQEALIREFELERIPFVSQPILNIRYKNIPLKQIYKPDFILFDKIILELKAVSAITKEHFAQLANYIKASNFRLGLLANFGASEDVDIRRFII